MFTIGDIVRVLPPFNVAFPDTYEINGIAPDTGSYQICGDRDFAEAYLEEVE